MATKRRGLDPPRDQRRGRVAGGLGLPAVHPDLRGRLPELRHRNIQAETYRGKNHGEEIECLGSSLKLAQIGRKVKTEVPPKPSATIKQNP